MFVQLLIIKPKGLKIKLFLKVHEIWIIFINKVK